MHDDDDEFKYPNQEPSSASSQSRGRSELVYFHILALKDEPALNQI